MARGLKIENLEPRDNDLSNIPSEASQLEDSEFLISFLVAPSKSKLSQKKDFHRICYKNQLQ